MEAMKYDPKNCKLVINGQEVKFDGELTAWVDEAINADPNFSETGPLCGKLTRDYKVEQK